VSTCGQNSCLFLSYKYVFNELVRTAYPGTQPSGSRAYILSLVLCMRICVLGISPPDIDAGWIRKGKKHFYSLSEEDVG
jgi:hypothetical protein